MKKGSLIIFPTDTIYGIGAKINDNEGINKIYKLKKRDFSKPLSVLFADLSQVRHLVKINSTSRKLINYFWPGPLTLILKTTSFYKKKNKENNLGIRQPKHPLALKLLKKHGPLKTTSVNISGFPPLNNYKVIRQIYEKKVDYIFYSSNQNLSKLSSTVLDLQLNNNFKILREGSITKEMIYKVIYNY
ncbi:Translation factor SUA5 [Candidatus Phytoplasma mali]|uniref:L-threonylcarbamoyladenylate synthase n=1 Tax=Phytoplasma mali (strain AT) TaxID=482235 RepID=B3R0J7_PHYMT|nr:L-threonylcarbamoyladenylate synthase [Candidatus Phytoplasma mali]CAP18361.1 Translation factor SUA5 [Candidatus Phytoplasma mali]